MATFSLKKNIIFALGLSMVPLIWARKFYRDFWKIALAVRGDRNPSKKDAYVK